MKYFHFTKEKKRNYYLNLRQVFLETEMKIDAEIKSEI